MFADELAGAIETLDADVIERDAAVHGRTHRRLGDDEQLGFLQERADLRRHGERLVPALQCAYIARPQQTEAGLEIGFEDVAGRRKGKIPRAEEREVVLRNPFQKLNGLGDFVDRKRRRRLSQLGDDATDPRQHRLPIVHADAHVGEDALKRPDDFICAAPHRPRLRYADG